MRVCPYRENYRDSSRAPAFTFFRVKIPLKAAYFEEKIHRKVEEVEEGREKKRLESKTYSTYSTSR
jgi:hypothetical protein